MMWNTSLAGLWIKLTKVMDTLKYTSVHLWARSLAGRSNRLAGTSQRRSKHTACYVAYKTPAGSAPSHSPRSEQTAAEGGGGFKGRGAGQGGAWCARCARGGSRPEHALRGAVECGAVCGWWRRSSLAVGIEPGPAAPLPPFPPAVAFAPTAAAAAAAAARGRGGGRGALSTSRRAWPSARFAAEGRAGSRGGHGQRGELGRRRRARRGGGGRGWRRLRGPFAEPGAGRRGGGPEPAERGGEEADRRCHVKGAGAAQREPRRRGAASHAKARTENRPSPAFPFPLSPSPRGGARCDPGPRHRPRVLLAEGGRQRGREGGGCTSARMEPTLRCFSHSAGF